MTKKIENRLNRFVGKGSFPYFFVFLLLLPSIAWIFLDNTAWPWDQAWYGEVSVDLYYKLTNGTFMEWLKAMVTAFGIKAPAIAWLGQFFVFLVGIVGSVDRALLMQVVIAQFLALFFIYKIVLHLTGKKGVALLGALVMASAPLFVGMGHQYLVESLQLFIVTFLIYVFINIGSWNVYNSILAMAIASAYAMLVKITSPLYIVILMLASLFCLIKPIKRHHIRKYFQSKRNIVLFIMGLILLAFSASWYAINWDNIINFMKMASAGAVAELYGMKGSFLDKLIFWLIYFQKSFFMPIVMYFVLLMIGIFLYQYIFLKKHKIFTLPVAVSISSLLLILIVFSFQVNEETRYLLPVFPYVVIVICWFLHKINNKPISALISAVFIFQFIFIHGYTLGIISHEGNNISTWVTVVHRNLSQKESIKGIVEETCKLEDANKINIVGVELPWLNANSAEYYASQKMLKTNYKCLYTSLGYAENDADRAMHRLKVLIDPPYFVTIAEEAFPSANSFNVVSESVAKAIENDPDFIEQGSLRTKSIRIFKNISEE